MSKNTGSHLNDASELMQAVNADSRELTQQLIEDCRALQQELDGLIKEGRVMLTRLRRQTGD